VLKARDDHGVPVVGLDLAGQEDGYPPGNHKDAYALAHKHFLNKTVHAGEAYGPESIFDAITELYADRLGHGLHLFNPDMIQDRDVQDKSAYINSLVQYIADHRITIEVCLTSNLQTNPEIKTLEQHPFKKMMDKKLSLSFCTDNRTVSSTTVTNEIVKAVDAFDITPVELKNFIIYGFKRSFCPGSYIEKRKYVREVINYYEQLEKSGNYRL
jgi:adenosine deaminase